MTADQMRAEQMIQQAHEEAESWAMKQDRGSVRKLLFERALLRDLIYHLCDPEQFPYPMTSPEL